jgi:hypothetical protein
MGHQDMLVLARPLYAGLSFGVADSEGSMRNQACSLLALIILLCGFPAYADDDPIKWSWKCASSGYYGMEVLPNGTYRPLTDAASTLEIRVRVSNDWKMCGASEYYIELSGNEFASLYDDLPCSQQVKLFFTQLNKQGDLETLDANIGHSMSLLVHRDDVEWRFVLSDTSLITARESRKLRIMAPNPKTNYDASANISMLTDECIITSGH